MFELACVDCGHLLTTRFIVPGQQVKFDGTYHELAIHAFVAHGRSEIDHKHDVVAVWTSFGATCQNPKLAERCETPWCYRLPAEHPTTAEIEIAAEMFDTLTEPDVPAGAGFGEDNESGPRARRARQRSEAAAIVAGGHWILPLVRVRWVGKSTLETIRRAA